jgi:hypothetical protein
MHVRARSAGKFISKADEARIAMFVDNAADGHRNRVAPGA